MSLPRLQHLPSYQRGISITILLALRAHLFFSIDFLVVVCHQQSQLLQLMSTLEGSYSMKPQGSYSTLLFLHWAKCLILGNLSSTKVHEIGRVCTLPSHSLMSNRIFHFGENGEDGDIFSYLAILEPWENVLPMSFPWHNPQQDGSRGGQ